MILDELVRSAAGNERTPGRALPSDTACEGGRWKRDRRRGSHVAVSGRGGAGERPRDEAGPAPQVTGPRLHDGKVARAAAVAGIDRAYCYRVLRRHGIAP